jgi:mannose-6-phosphate isomerase-like protein (cupin superfamily)
MQKNSPSRSERDEDMNLQNQYCYFFEEEEFKETNRDGFRRRVITGENMQLWFWRIRGGSTGSFMHNHVETEQLGIIMRGKLDFRIGDKEDAERVVLGEGEVYLAPQSVWHGDSLFIGDEELNEVWILDVFSPPRTDI